MNCKILTSNDDKVNKDTREPIKLVKFLNSSLQFVNVTPTSIRGLKNLELISRGYSGGLDLIFGYANDRNCAVGSLLFLGYWNDGIWVDENND